MNMPQDPTAFDTSFGLLGEWPDLNNFAHPSLPSRFEGEARSLPVLGKIPDAINGTFYRVSPDPLFPPDPRIVWIDGDGVVSALRIHNGKADFKNRYVETERLKLEKKAGRALFGLYRNPYSHHPCVKAAIDSVANTNVAVWAGKLFAMKESALPYEVDPDTLETMGYDPFGQVESKTFTAHPKADPYTEELVVFGYEAKGLATNDIVIYAIDKTGKVKDVQWVKGPWVGFMHDCAITENFIVIPVPPFEADLDRMEAGGTHFEWKMHRELSFLVVPRRRGKALPPGWTEGETRVYPWRNGMTGHSAGAWEENGKLYIESGCFTDNMFPFFNEEGRHPDPASIQISYVRWEIDLSKPTGTHVSEPKPLYSGACEFPRCDERFFTHKVDHSWLACTLPSDNGAKGPAHAGLNGLMMHRNSTGKQQFFNPGPACGVSEPVFVPRDKNAAEGDGWVIAMVERKLQHRNDCVILDTRDFSKPVAIIQMPFYLKAQIHGNWVDEEILDERPNRPSMLKPVEEVEIVGKGAISYL
ncbi:isoeugenol monooxygenase [Zopfia rhizophila CBS 207.26]|uniref:Isoeugenol monooxygenase n=1 Tax=Zopfia rhizophila CBS 207.26 TaxID=1314779 RepID=A0A6A6DPW1_9PEZI|nr:isoeugenol monooxygenase [Zopfia rhizophila CBS 207.26]